MESNKFIVFFFSSVSTCDVKSCHFKVILPQLSFINKFIVWGMIYFLTGTFYLLIDFNFSMKTLRKKRVNLCSIALKQWMHAFGHDSLHNRKSRLPLLCRSFSKGRRLCTAHSQIHTGPDTDGCTQTHTTFLLLRHSLSQSFQQRWTILHLQDLQYKL